MVQNLYRHRQVIREDSPCDLWHFHLTKPLREAAAKYSYECFARAEGCALAWVPSRSVFLPRRLMIDRHQRPDRHVLEELARGGAGQADAAV
jgi:hypothetical protein